MVISVKYLDSEPLYQITIERKNQKHPWVEVYRPSDLQEIWQPKLT